MTIYFHLTILFMAVRKSRIKLFLFAPYTINILLTGLSRSLIFSCRSVWENRDLGSVYRPHYVRSVLTTTVKIFPYRPPARSIELMVSKLGIAIFARLKTCHRLLFTKPDKTLPLAYQTIHLLLKTAGTLM